MNDQHNQTRSNHRSTLRRRSLLQSALIAPVAGATAIGLPAVTGATSGSSPSIPETGPAVATSRPAGQINQADPRDARFTIAVLPDTQYLFDEDSTIPAPLEATFAWLIEHRAARNIVFLTHLGDVVEHGSDLEVGFADRTFLGIDGQIPYSVLAGNHDIDGSLDDTRGPSAWLAAFGPDRFADSPTYAGSDAGGYNSYHILTAGGREWLIFALDWRPSATGLAWAQSVIDAHSRLPIILTIHDFVSADDDGQAELSENGELVWNELVRRNDQIFLTINGHWWPTGRMMLTNDAGNTVHSHISNYQDRYFGGAAMIRLYGFDLSRNVIDVETFSPYLMGLDPETRAPLETECAVLSGPVERFTVEIPFRERFAGFAPEILPATRPAATVISEDTAAYWRFDNAGITVAVGAVPDGTVAMDLTGNGNDLVVERLHASGPEALIWSGDHHPNQPAHASLRFGGAQSPNRGALLRALPDAPINSETFQDGYTIELFLKLPATFDGGEHAFMGIFSWEGRNGDAGKTTGYALEEPTCSLNLASERFLQYVVYPTNVDADPTSWSHAIPVDRWMHIAVVNDSHRTVIYIDGSKIARNPAQESRGITTMGLPFVLGGTGYDLAYGQGFYGLLGDVRISTRALAPSEFLTPFG